MRESKTARQNRLKPKEMKGLARVVLCYSKGSTFLITLHASLVFGREIMGEQKQRAGDREGESRWVRWEIGHTSTVLQEKE